MHRFIREFENRFNKSWMREHIISLYKLEYPQTFPAYQAAAKYVYDLLVKEGFEAELVDIPADGKSVYQDVRMPIGWDVKNMTLTLLTDVDGIENSVIADCSKNPCSAVKHSVSTPEGGIRAKLILEDAMHSGEDVKGHFVLFDRSTRPGGKNIKEILDRGAIGFVSDYCENPGEAPDCTGWLNAATETGSWHVQADDRDFISYLISENQGEPVRKACMSGDVWVEAYSDARRYESTLPFVSALLPGKSDKEVWVMAHMYEPLIDDNANGVIGSIAILKSLRDMADEGLISLDYSVRLVFAAEIYGFATAAEYYGGDLSKRAIGGINMDGLPASLEKGKHRSWRIFEAPDYPSNIANLILHQVKESACELHPNYSFTTVPAMLGDDQALGDSTVGLPTAWFLRGGYNCFHHNSILTDDYLDMDVFVDTLTLSASWICAMVSLAVDDILRILPDCLRRSQEFLNDRAGDAIRQGVDADKRMRFLYNREKERILSFSLRADLPEISAAAESLTIPKCHNSIIECDDKWYNLCEKYIFKRKTRGLPMDMTRIHDRDRQELRGFMVYYPIADFLSSMDGEKSFKTLVTEYEWKKNTVMDDSKIEQYLNMCLNLAEYGYLDFV